MRQHNKASGRFSNFDTEEQYAILKHSKMDLYRRDSLLKEDYIANLQFIEQYSARNNVSESQQKIFRQFLLYKFAAARLNFHMKSPAKVAEYVFANRSMYDSIRPMVQCDTCSVYPNYDYLTRLFAKVYIADPAQGSMDTIYKKYQDNFTGITREHLLFDLVKFGGMFNETRPNPELAKRFLSHSLDTSLANHIRTIYGHYTANNDSANIRSSMATTSLSDFNNNRLTWEKLLEKYRGKLIYVDLWASWCGPCRSGIPISLSLQKRFTDDDFKVLFVSIDDDIVDWKKASADHKLLAGESYIVHAPQQSALKKKYSIDFIPRYFLIGKDGKMIDQNAPGPGSEKMVQLIKQFL